MKIEIFYEAKSDFTLAFEDRLFSVPAGCKSITVEYDSFDHDKTYSFSIESSNPIILTKNVLISKIIFDDFWELVDDQVAFGANTYFDSYVRYANIHNLKLDREIRDNNMLCFMGRIDFKFRHPIRDFIHER
jgi:hypothetical protein